jgi:4-amino-4-deoxy-L-arabinose transferase-like glycosyltransferase
MSEKQTLSAAAVLAVVVCFAGIGSHHLWSPDEPTGAAIGRAMLDSGDVIVPRLNGQPFLEKPPLYWWVQVPVLRRFGLSAAAARFPSALFSALTLLVAYGLGRRVGGPRTGLLAVAVLGSTVLFVQEAQRVVVDPALAFFVALAHFGFVLLAEPRSPAERRAAVGLIALAVPLAFLSKGIVALGLTVAPPVLWLLATRRLRAWRDLLPLALVGAPVFALLAGAWAAALVQAAGWPALQECLLNNTAGRFLPHENGTVYGHTRPFWYYLVTAPAVVLPWSVAIPAMLRAGLLRRAGRPGGETRSLLFATFGIGIFLLSLAASKRELYLLPLLPAFAACVAWWLAGEQEEDSDRRWDQNTATALLLLASVLPVLLWGTALGARWLPRSRALAPLQAELTPAVLAVYGLAGLIGGALIFRRLIRLRSEGAGLPVSWLVLPFLLLFLAVETDVEARIDPVKRLSDLTAALPLHEPARDAVPAYLPPRVSAESVYGIIGFDLGRRTLPLTTPDELRAYLDRRPCARVVLRAEEIAALPPDLRRRLRIVYDERGRKAAPFLIAGGGACPSPVYDAAVRRAAALARLFH